MKRNKLTVKQRKFITNYVTTGNATQSAIDAGYPLRSAHSIATENLKKPAIIAYREQLEAAINTPKVMSAIERKERLSEIAREDNITDKGSLFRGPNITAISELNKMDGSYAPERHINMNVNVKFVIGKGYVIDKREGNEIPEGS